MRFMRLIVADRSSGGILAALLAVMVFLQVLLGGAAAGAGVMPAAAADICTSAETGPADHRDHRPDCPCGLLCQASLQLLAAIDGPAAGSAQPIRFAVAIERPRLLPPAPSRGDVGLHKDAQGPPAIRL